MRSRHVLFLAPLALAFGCTDPLPGDWEMTQGWCIDDQACAEGEVVEYPTESEANGCVRSTTGSLNITDDWDGAFNFLTTLDGSCEYMEFTVRFEIDDIEELEKDSFYQIDVQFPGFEESLDCRLKNDDNAMDCVSKYTQQDILFER